MQPRPRKRFSYSIVKTRKIEIKMADLCCTQCPSHFLNLTFRAGAAGVHLGEAMAGPLREPRAAPECDRDRWRSTRR